MLDRLTGAAILKSTFLPTNTVLIMNTERYKDMIKDLTNEALNECGNGLFKPLLPPLYPPYDGWTQTGDLAETSTTIITGTDTAKDVAAEEEEIIRVPQRKYAYTLGRDADGEPFLDLFGVTGKKTKRYQGNELYELLHDFAYIIDLLAALPTKEEE